MIDFLELMSDDPASMLLWIGLALVASVVNGLMSLLLYRRGRKSAPPDFIGHALEFAVVVLIIGLAFVCRLTVGRLLHAPVFFTCILISVAAVECGRTFNRYLEMRGIGRRINIDKTIDKALGLVDKIMDKQPTNTEE